MPLISQSSRIVTQSGELDVEVASNAVETEILAIVVVVVGAGAGAGAGADAGVAAVAHYQYTVPFNCDIFRCWLS